MSSRKTNSFSIKLHPVEYLYVQNPVERRERKKTASFSMPPSVNRRLSAYAKQQRMSASDLVTILCVNFLESVKQSGRTIQTGKRSKDLDESQPKDLEG